MCCSPPARWTEQAGLFNVPYTFHMRLEPTVGHQAVSYEGHELGDKSVGYVSTIGLEVLGRIAELKVSLG